MQRCADVKQDVSSSNWQLLLASLLNKKTDNPGFSVAMTEDKEVVISTHDPLIATQLNTILESPEAVRTNLKYTLELKGAEKTPIYETNYSELKLPGLKYGMGKTIFTNLFGDINLQRIGAPEWQQELGGDHFVLTGICEEELKELTQDQFKKYVGILKSATFKELREALSDAKKPLKLGKKTNGVLEQNADKIIYITKDSSGKSIACFDFGLLIRCLAAPHFVAAQQSEQLYQIKFNANHFMSYLSTVLNEGFLLQISDDTHEARPICFNPMRAVPLEIVISFVLDCSGSMEQVFSSYVDQVIRFIEEMATTPEYVSAKIRIQPFSTDLFAEIEKPLTEAPLLVDYLKKLNSDGETRLNEAVLSELKVLESRSTYTTGSVAIFTDAEDNKSPPEVTDALEKLTTGLKTNGNPTKVFTFGFGPEYNEEKSKQLSVVTGGEHYKLGSIDEFKTHLSAHINDYCKARRLMRFIEEESKRILTVVVKEGELAVSSQTLTIPNTFSINGDKTYNVRLGGLELERKRSNSVPSSQGLFKNDKPITSQEESSKNPKCIIM